MAESVNTQIADALTAQQLRDARVESQLRRDAWVVLALLEADILAALKVTDPTQFALLAQRRRDVETLMREEIDPLIVSRYTQLATMLDDALMRLARHEAGVVQQVVNDATEEETITDLPSERRLRAGVVHGLFPSAATPTDLSTTGRDWWARQGASFSQRLGDSLTVGVSLEESLVQLTQRVRGTPEKALTDGLMARARDDAARLVRTQTTNAVSEARVAVAERNARPQFILIHHAILDSRTSNLCLGRHGLQFTSDTHEPIGHSVPYLSGPPYHVNALIGGTHVLTSDGLLDIADVSIGMLVLTHRGRWRCVTETMREFNQARIVRVLRTDTGRILFATDEHPILTAHAGWCRVDELQVGNQCFEYMPESVQADTLGMARPQTDMMSQQYPAFRNQGLRANGIMGDALSPIVGISVDFNSNMILRPGEIKDIDTDRVLKNHARYACGWQECEHLLFHRRGMVSQIFCSPSTHFDHCLVLGGRIGLCHAVTMSLKQRRSLFTQAISPMLFPSPSIGLSFGCRCERCDACATCTDSDPIPLAPPIQRGCGDPVATFDGTQGTSLLPVFLLDDLPHKGFISQINHAFRPSFSLSTIISIDEVVYNGFVYNLAVDEDESYLAESIVVHNCRSTMIVGMRGGGPIMEQNLNAWLRRRGPAFQDEVLGPTRARMWREGKLGSVRHLIDALTGKPLTLEELGA